MDGAGTVDGACLEAPSDGLAMCGGHRIESLPAALRAEIRKPPKAEEYETAGVHHIAMVLWGRGARMQVAGLDRWAGCRVWLEAGPHDVVFAWVGRRSPFSARDVDLLVSHLDGWRGGAAFGGPAFDLSGFSRSHQQALVSYAVARACGDNRLRYATAQFLTLLASDRDHAVEFVGEMLGPLSAVKASRSARLLVTLEAYLGHGHSVSAAALASRCSRATIRRHLDEIGEALGLDVETHGAELLAALRLRRLLGVKL